MDKTNRTLVKMNILITGTNNFIGKNLNGKN